MNDKRLLKVVILGDSGVGKTSILKNYVDNCFNMHTKPTLGVNCMSKTLNINQTKVTLQVNIFFFFFSLFPFTLIDL